MCLGFIMRLYNNTSAGDPLLGRLCQHACGLELSTNTREYFTVRSLYKLKERGADQDLLREHVWGVWGRGDACQHDSYTCDTHPGTTGWPTRRLNTTDHNFFGAGGDNNVA